MDDLEHLRLALSIRNIAIRWYKTRLALVIVDVRSVSLKGLLPESEGRMQVFAPL